MKLSDPQWKVIEPLLPVLKKRKDGRGRPWIESRSILDGILWALRSGARRKICGSFVISMIGPLAAMMGRSNHGLKPARPSFFDGLRRAFVPVQSIEAEWATELIPKSQNFGLGEFLRFGHWGLL